MYKHIPEKLRSARRALDSLKQISIINDWEFDEQLNNWYLRLAIAISNEKVFLPKKSNWYVVVETIYPQGKISVYPDIENSLSATLYHQANNSEIEVNGLWRKGALCLELNTVDRNEREPFDNDIRLLFHISRAITWLEAAISSTLISEGEPFELPDFKLSNMSKIHFVFSEDVVTFMQWESSEIKFGIAELDVYKSNPLFYYVKNFNNLNGKNAQNVQWGKFLSQLHTPKLMSAPWLLLKQVPVLNVWQAPSTLKDLVNICHEQDIDFLNILRLISPKIRDGKRHPFLIGFPIPKYFQGEDHIIFWQAFYLPALSSGKWTTKGFRTNEKGFWRRDRLEILTDDTKLQWIESQNWNQNEIATRGKICDSMQRKNILLVGAGCLGASIAEILVRDGIYNLTIADFDLLEIGNLCRHTLSLSDVGEIKEDSLGKHLNRINPNAIVDVINKKLNFDENYQSNIDLEKYDIIIDCTGSKAILEGFNHVKLKCKHILASASVGFGAKRLYLSMMKECTFDFSLFFKLISTYLQEEKIYYDDFELPRDGIGCWHPTFPARSDDIWLAAATAVKNIENYILNGSDENVSFVYEQKQADGYFEGYKMVGKI